ncbi:MAG: VCBS domain-containing protein [Candidatus Promineofilum sp.]|nr:VCBS domain-containing protein [Promineifilum sp.]
MNRLNLRILYIPFLLALLLVFTTLAHSVRWVSAAELPPMLDLNGDATGSDFAATFTEDEGAESIVNAIGLTITNGEDDVLTAAEAILTNRPDSTVEMLAADPGATGLTVKYAADTGKLTIKGDGSVAAYQQVLRSLIYNNLSQSPDITDRIVMVTVSDGPQTSVPATSIVAINGVNDAPVLDNSGDMTMTPINEDDQDLKGNQVTTIIKSAEAGGQDRITDVDKNSSEGFAVVEVGAANGAWQFSINSGITWETFVNISNTSAVVLDGTARIRFVPNPNFNGSASFSFRAWDLSGGRPTGTTGVDVSENGGTTAFSAAIEMVTLNILAVNDLSRVDLNGSLTGADYAVQFFEGGAAVFVADPTATISDDDNTMLSKLTITLTNRPDADAESLTVDTTGTNIKADAYNPATGQLILNGPDSVTNFQTALRRVKYLNGSLTPTNGVRAVTVVASDGVNDGPAATSSISVNPPNSAPVLDPAAAMTLVPVAEDNPQPAGQLIAAILATGGNPITDADSGALEGIAIVDADSTHGQWQYSLANPPTSEADWKPVGAVSGAAALVLNDDAWLRFLPAANYSGMSGALTFRAWDRTSGSSGLTADTSINGGTSAFSASTNAFSVMITPVNDLPLLGGLPTEPLQYIEDASPLVLAGSLTVIDGDSPFLASATVRITNAVDGDAEWLLVTTDGTGISASYEDGVLQLNGAASPAAYQQVLRSVKYWNASQDPEPDDRVFQFTAADNQGSSPPSSLVVKVQPVNDPAELDLNGNGSGTNFVTTFFINRGPVPVVDEGLVVNDVDNTTIKSATVRITNIRNKQAEFLTADISGAANIKPLQYDPLTGELKLEGVDSVANYQRVLRTVTYDNILPQPDTATRTIEFIVDDGLDKSEPRQTVVTIAQAPKVQLFMPMVSSAALQGEEPNNRCTEAVGLALNIDQPFRADDKDDWFYFDTTESNVLTVELRNFTPGAGQIVVAAEKSPGQGCSGLELLGNNGSSGPDKTVPLGRQPARRYYVWVINDGAISANTVYRLYVRAVP